MNKIRMDITNDKSDLMKETLVSLVGAGPGDPSLLTLKAIKRLREADCIFYDALVNPVILSYCRKGIKRVSVGKRCGKHSHEQGEINRILVERAKKGGKIVRLKGGDPFVFGRGGEEMLALKENNIPYEIVPGLSSALAVTAYSGIPITHRAVSRSATLITASTRDKKIDNTSWKALAEIQGTLIFYMGTNVIPKLCERLMSSGMSPKTPACVISNGTLPNQSCIKATLEQFKPDFLDYTKLSPGLFVVGDVADFAETYAFYKPDKFARIKLLCVNVSTPSSKLSKFIEAEGGYQYTLPTTETIIRDLNDEEIQRLHDINSNDAILFTSQDSVTYLSEQLLRHGRDMRSLSSTFIVSIGTTTTNKLLSLGMKPDYVAKNKSVIKFIDEMLSIPLLRTKNLFFMHGFNDGYTLPLSKIYLKGRLLKDLSLFSSRLIQYTEDDVRFLKEICFTHVLFTSSKAVKNFNQLMFDYHLEDIILPAKNIAMGPMTEEAMRNANIFPSYTSQRSSLEDVLSYVNDSIDKL